MKDHLRIRKEMKRRKPKFTRQDAHKKPRLGKKWRRPKGIQSKMRLQKKGYNRIVKKGYRGPKDVRGLDAEGKENIFIGAVREINEIDPSKSVGVIRGAVGKRKRREIIQIAIKKNLKIVNVKDPEGFLTSMEERQKKRKEEKDQRVKAKQDRKKERKVEKKESQSEEERKKKEKEEKEKVLTKGK